MNIQLWVQDCNWPISFDVIPIIIQFQEVALPHISKILQPNLQIFDTINPEQIDGKVVPVRCYTDDIRKYWLIACVIPYFSYSNQKKLLPLIQRIALHPTESEITIVNLGECRLDKGDEIRMPKKRITLVKDFCEILESGNLEEIKAVFEKCDINAKTDKYGFNAFGQRPLSREAAFWLKEQGCDINQKDYYGDTPVLRQISRYQGNLKLMLELGADVNAIDRSGYTLLHKVAMQGTKEDVLLLLEQGLDINAKQLCSKMHSEMYTPLEVLFYNYDGRPSELQEMAELFISGGAKITDRVKAALIKKGKSFEFYRADYNSDMLDADSLAMDSLYELIKVEYPQKVEKHDGISPIVAEGETRSKLYTKLWDYLVPSKGMAKTAQGEVIRIAGKVAREIMDNGGINWDKNYQKMLDVFPIYCEQGNKLSKEEIDEIKSIVKTIYYGNGADEPEKLMDYAVKWIMQNQAVLPVIQSGYNR